MLDIVVWLEPAAKGMVVDEPVAGLDSVALEQGLQRLRDELTVMPRFGYHQPLDYLHVTKPAAFEEPVRLPGEDLPLPPVSERMGYAAEDDAYLAWGKTDHDLILERIRAAGVELKTGQTIMDFGCSSGRVLRHFKTEMDELDWKLIGVDVQARPIQWMRENFPPSFEVYTGTVLPHLPFEDNSIDFIYGFSVFTHIKFLWDAWLLELRRVLKPGGLLLPTYHSEKAWKFFHNNREHAGFKAALPSVVLDNPSMDVDYLYHGDIGVSQIFWKRKVALSYWGRYLKIVGDYPPVGTHSFQDMIVCQKGDSRALGLGSSRRLKLRDAIALAGFPGRPRR